MSIGTQLKIVWAEQWPVVVSFLVGGLVVFLLVAMHSNKQIEQLKQYGDSLKVVAQQRDSATKRANDSTKAVVATLHKTEQAFRLVVANNKKIDSQLDTALAAATTDSGRVVILTQQNANLRNENLNLEQALANVTAQRDAETERADRNLQALNQANADILKLNARIQHLGPTVPGWVRTSVEVIAVGGAFYAGTKVK